MGIKLPPPEHGLSGGLRLVRLLLPPASTSTDARKIALVRLVRLVRLVHCGWRAFSFITELHAGPVTRSGMGKKSGSPELEPDA